MFVGQLKMGKIFVKINEIITKLLSNTIFIFFKIHIDEFQ